MEKSYSNWSIWRPRTAVIVICYSCHQIACKIEFVFSKTSVLGRKCSIKSLLYLWYNFALFAPRLIKKLPLRKSWKFVFFNFSYSSMSIFLQYFRICGPRINLFTWRIKLVIYYYKCRMLGASSNSKVPELYITVTEACYWRKA